MPCFYPIRAWRSADFSDLGKTGKLPLVFRQDLGLPNTELQIACGRCMGCRLDKARSWAIRCLHEATEWETNCFITLTYSDSYLPENGSLEKEHFVKFMKRFRRKHEDRTIRFFQCGEYGDELGRPHHHAIIFNYDFPDRVPFKKTGENPLFLSNELADLWPYGLHAIGDLTFDSACYTARYILKKQTGENADEHYQGKLPEYVTMSRRPGIGRNWYEKYKTDLYNHDVCVVDSDFVCRPPKYYDNLYDLEEHDHLQALKRKRVDRAKNNPDNNYHRLDTKRRIAEIKQKKIERKYEQNENKKPYR